MTYEIAIIISVLISVLVILEWIEIRIAKKRIELMRSMYEIVNEYKALILDLADDLDKMKAELDKLKKLQEE